MALSTIQVSNIAADAMALHEALQAHGADIGRADQWVTAAMPTIVAAEAGVAGSDEPLVTPRGGYELRDRQQAQAEQVHGISGRTLEDPEAEGLQGPPP